MQHECSDLIEQLYLFRGRNYSEMFSATLQMMAESRGNHQLIGSKEVWIVDFVPALARTFPEAWFILIIPDPRAVLAQPMKSPTRIPGQKNYLFTILRHWRKIFAHTVEFLNRSDLRARIHLLRCEDLINEPEKTVNGFCKFFQVASAAEMMETSRFVSGNEESIWEGNSSLS